MELTFYLKKEQPDKNGRLMIHCRICWQSQKVRFSTGKKVLPVDFKNEKVLSGLTGYAAINLTLNTYRSELETYFYQHYLTKSAITLSEIQNEIDRIRTQLLGKKPKLDQIATVQINELNYPTLFAYLPQYILERRADRSKDWARSVQALTKRLHDFRPDLDWPDLKLSTLNLFKVYLQEDLGLSDATIHAYIALLRGACQYAERLEIPVPRDYKWLEFRQSRVIRPVLEWDEVEEIAKADLSYYSDLASDDSLLIERVRWFFLMACYTGLRISDQWQLCNPIIQHVLNVPCLIVLQQKTRKKVAIPLTEKAYELLNNPVDTHGPPDQAVYNSQLRLIGKLAGLTRTTTVGSFYKGELVPKIMPLYQALSSHVGRRTFATAMLNAGMNSFTLKELLGHESIESTHRYLTFSSESIVQQVKAVWNKQSDSKTIQADPI